MWWVSLGPHESNFPGDPSLLHGSMTLLKLLPLPGMAPPQVFGRLHLGGLDPGETIGMKLLLPANPSQLEQILLQNAPDFPIPKLYHLIALTSLSAHLPYKTLVRILRGQEWFYDYFKFPHPTTHIVYVILAY